MPSRRSSLLLPQAARSSKQTGCLSIVLLPLAGILTAGLFIILASGDFRPSGSQPYGPGATAQPGHLAAFYSPAVQFWGASIETWAKQWAIDANLVATVMQIESCGDPAAVSKAGAKGLFQVMPFHFTSGENAQDPETNAKRGLAYLKKSLDLAHGDVRMALASYNGGTGLINQDETEWPDETLNYAYWGAGIYQDAAQGASSSKTLNQWLTQGGWRLCLQASQRLGVRP